MRTLTIALLVIISACVCTGQAEYDLLFRAPFEDDLTANVAGGDPEPVWSRGGTEVIEDDARGNCARVPDGGSLTYDAPGNVYWERGTLSFWWLCEDAVGSTEFDVATLGAFDYFYYGRWLRLYASGGKLYMHLWDWHYDSTRHLISSGDFEPESGTWYHIALGWDAAKGYALYVDGDRVGSSERTFYIPVNINQIGLGVSATSAHARASATRTQRFDDVRVYDRWLSDEDVAAVAEGGDPVGTPIDEDLVAAHRIQSLNLDDTDGMPVVPRDGRALVVTQPQIVTAKDVLRTQMTGVDGKLTTKWPSRTRYAEEGHRYDIEMAGEPVNYVCMSASHTGAVQLVSGERGQVVLERTTDDPFVTRALLDEPIMADSAHVTREVSEEDTRHDGAMADLQLLNVSTEDVTDVPAEAPITFIRPADLGAEWEIIKGEQHPLRDVSWLLTPGDGPPGGGVHPMRSLHVASDVFEERTRVSGISLTFDGMRSDGDAACHLQLMHPLNYTRRQMILDFRIEEGDGPVQIVLDPRDLVVEAGQRLRMELQFTGDFEWRSASLGLETETVATADEQYFPDQMRMMKMYFMRLSEARPWGWDPTKIKLLGELYACMEQLRELRPDDPQVVAYYHWTHYWEPKPRPELPPVPEGMPEWAWYQVKLRELCRGVPEWWIDNRQVESGEFGSNDGPNDDSVLVQDFAGLHFMDGPDEKLLHSARTVSNMCWRRTMEDGMNRQVTDPLHAYEWGANVNNMLAVMDYGNPRWVERMLEMGKHYDELTGINPLGHRHYRSNRYGASQIVTEGRYGWDTTSNALNMQSAALLGWYNGHPQSRQYMTEWVDAWTEDIVDPEDGKGRAYTVEFETGAKQPQRLLSYAWPYIPWACYDQTGDERFLRALPLTWEADRRHYDGPQRSQDVLQQLLRHTDREDIRANLREVIAAIDLWESPIRYTDSRPELKYIEWLMTGDESAVTEALKATLSDMTWELPMYTTAEQSPDRLWLPQPLLNHMMLGDIALLRNRIYPTHWVSWEGHAGALAAWVLEKRPDYLRVWLVNTGEETIAPVMRAWRLEHGRYEVRLGADADGDGQIDDAAEPGTVELARGMRMPVPALQPRRPAVLEITQTEALEPITDRPDLAIGEGDLAIDPATGQATLTIHNIGARNAGPFTVRVARKGREEQTAVEIAGLPAPQGFAPSRVEVGLPGLNLSAGATMLVAVDPEDAIAEITEDNNEAVLTAATGVQQRVEGMHPVTE